MLFRSVGKTQFLMQSLLTVQLPFDRGGLNGQAILLYCQPVLPTNRLVTLARYFFPDNDPNDCLANIFILQCRDFTSLQHALDYFIPQLLDDKNLNVRLIGIDSIGMLSREFVNNYHGLHLRNCSLINVSNSLKSLSHNYRLTVIVVNGVNDSVNFIPSNLNPLNYHVQSLNFSGQLVHQSKQSQLGLTWATLIHTRLMLVRTIRKVDVNVNNKEMLIRNDQNSLISLPYNNNYHQFYNFNKFNQVNFNNCFKVHKRRAHIIFSTYLKPNQKDFYILPIGLKSLNFKNSNSSNSKFIDDKFLTPTITQSIDESEANYWASLSFSDDDEYEF